MNIELIKILNKADGEFTTESFEDVDTLIHGNYESPLKVLVAALAIKIYDPSCDTRLHQKAHKSKYCLRTHEYETTQWGASQMYFSTNSPGTLSNALRHKEPYNKQYSRVWKSEKCKTAFLNLFEMMNTSICAESILIYTLQSLQQKRKAHESLANSVLHSDNTNELYPLLCDLCKFSFGKCSVLPVLIVHTMFQIKQNPGLVSLKSHTSPDYKCYGDIELWDDAKTCPSIVIEIKHNLEIKEAYLQTFARKVKNMNTQNFLLTSLIYQRYLYNKKYNVVCWNVASYVHYNLYNTGLEQTYIHALHNRVMASNLQIEVKEKLKNCFVN